MFALCNSKTNYSRSEGEVYASLGRAGFRVYCAVQKEFGGFFLKFDESSLTLTPNVQEYTMPVDFSQMVHLSERISASENWRPMSPIDLDTAVNNVQQALGWDDFYSSIYGYESQFGYYGPFLDSTATAKPQALQIQKIRITPNPSQTHFCQLAYTAKWIPITDASSIVMLPDEGTYAMESFASAELCAMNDDTRAQYYEGKGQSDLSSFLSWVRNRQIQTTPTIDTYGPGW
jgi:hypothetical protein